MLDETCVVRHQPISSFLNRFFSPADTPTADTYRNAQSETQNDALSNQNVRTKEQPSKSTKKTEIKYQAYGSEYRTESLQDRLRIVNMRAIRLFERSRTLPLGVRIVVPPGFFGLINCLHPPGCVCVTDIIGVGTSDARAHLANITQSPIEIPPGTLQIYIHMLPQIIPEPWQTMNLPAPHLADKYYDLRVRRTVQLNPRSTKYLTFDAAHLCPESTQNALIVPFRHMTFRRIIVEPCVWPSHCMPVVKVVNVSQTALQIPAGTAVAKAIFTLPGITQITPALTSVIRSLDIPSTLVSFSKMSQSSRHNK